MKKLRPKKERVVSASQTFLLITLTWSKGKSFWNSIFLIPIKNMFCLHRLPGARGQDRSGTQGGILGAHNVWFLDLANGVDIFTSWKSIILHTWALYTSQDTCYISLKCSKMRFYSLFMVIDIDHIVVKSHSSFIEYPLFAKSSDLYWKYKDKWG